MPEKNKRFFQTKLGLVVPILCLCFLAGSLVFLFYMMRENTRDKALYLDNAAKQNQGTILKQIQGDFQSLRGVATLIGDTQAVDTGEIYRVLQKINLDNAFIRMGFADLDGDVCLADIDGSQYHLNLTGRDFFEEALTGQEVVSDTIQDTLSPGTYINYYAVPVKNLSDQIIGVLCAVNSTDILREIVDVPLLNGTGFSSIIDSKGNLVVRSIRQQAAENNPYHLSQLGAFAPQDLKRIQKALEAGENTTFTYTISGQSQLGVVEPIGINGWFVISSIPQSVLNQQYSRTAIGTSIIIAVACILFMLLFYLQRRTMTQNHEKLLHLAYDDPLTGLGNFEKFQLEAPDILQNSGNRTYAFWYCDIKQFKYFNDLYGYHMGDKLLRWISEVFQRFSSEKDLFCRISADNFAGLRAYTEKQDLERWFSSILEYLKEAENASAQKLHIQLSMGFYCPEEADLRLSVKDLVNRANMAQKAAKIKPGGRAVFFTDAIRQQSLNESALESAGKRALEKGEFVLYMQPKVNIQEGDRIAGAEVLARWLHPEKGIVSPGVFIPLFEKSGLIVDLDRYVFEKACAWYCAHMLSGGPPINLAVNVSRLGLLQDDFVEHYTRIKRLYGIPDGVLEIEFTESIVLDNSLRFLATVKELQAQGFICSLDDFGAGYSSLNILKNLPINVLKLDILFFRESVDIHRERIVISNIIRMSQELQIKIIAEGVETVETVDFLRRAGCNIVQGFVFSKPLPLETFEKLLASHSYSSLTARNAAAGQ